MFALGFAVLSVTAFFAAFVGADFYCGALKLPADPRQSCYRPQYCSALGCYEFSVASDRCRFRC